MLNRNPAITNVMRFFESDHLPEPLRSISRQCRGLADSMLEIIEIDDPELTAGLRKLLEAKDCFVRAGVVQGNKEKGEPVEGKPLS